MAAVDFEILVKAADLAITRDVDLLNDTIPPADIQKVGAIFELSPDATVLFGLGLFAGILAGRMEAAQKGGTT